MDNSEDLFEELRTKQNNADVVNQTTDQNTSKELFDGRNEKLIKILQENSSKKIEINAEEDENTNYAKTSTSSRGLEQNNVVLKSLSVEREIVELTVNTAKEDESKAFERDEICKYIDEENINEKNYLKLLK